MSRTNRKCTYSGDYLRYYRRPKTKNEKKHLVGLIKDNYVEEYNISGMNRVQHRKLVTPTSWEDIRISAVYEIRHHE